MADPERRRMSDYIVAGAAVIGVAVSIASMIGTWFIYGYRIDANEKQLVEVKQEIVDMKKDNDDMHDRMAKLEATYGFVINEMRRHRWDLPPGWENR